MNSVASSESSEMCEPTDESRNTLRQQEHTMAIEKLQPTVHIVSNTDSNLDETLGERENSANGAIMKPCRETVGVPTASRTKVTKVNKKRQISDEIQGTKKRKKSKNVIENIVKKFSKESEQEQVEENKNAVVFTKSVSSKSRDEENNLSEQDKQPNQSDEMDEMISKDIASLGKDVARESNVSTHGKTLPGDKTKKRKSIISSRDVVVKGNPTNNETSSQEANSSASKLHVSDEKPHKRKDLSDGRDQSSSTSEQRTHERESNESASIKEEVSRSPSSEVLDQNWESKQNPKFPEKPEFLHKKTASSTNVRVASGENGSVRKKCLPKLIKTAFKPPMASKDGNTSKIPKMPKLLKPHFVSPAVSLPESNHKEFGVGKISDKSVAHSVASKKDVEPKKEQELKRKAHCKDSSLANPTSKREKKDDGRHGRANDISSGKDLDLLTRQIYFKAYYAFVV